MSGPEGAPAAVSASAQSLGDYLRLSGCFESPDGVSKKQESFGGIRASLDAFVLEMGRKCGRGDPKPITRVRLSDNRCIA